MPPERGPVTPAQARRRVRLTVPVEPVELTTVPAPRRRMPVPPRPMPRDRVLRLAELVVGAWAPTLRAAFLRVVLFLGVLIALGIAFGSGAALLTGLAGVVAFLVGRRRAGPGD